MRPPSGRSWKSWRGEGGRAGADRREEGSRVLAEVAALPPLARKRGGSERFPMASPSGGGFGLSASSPASFQNLPVLPSRSPGATGLETNQ